MLGRSSRFECIAKVSLQFRKVRNEGPRMVKQGLRELSTVASKGETLRANQWSLERPRVNSHIMLREVVYVEEGRRERKGKEEES